MRKLFLSAACLTGVLLLSQASTTLKEVTMRLPRAAWLPVECRGDSACWVIDRDDEQGRLKRHIVVTDKDTASVEEMMARRFFVTRGDTVAETGFEKRSTGMVYDHPIVILTGRRSLGDSIAGRYSGRGKYYGTSDIGVNGSYYSVVDGRGSIMADGARLDGITRVHHHREWKQILTKNAAEADSFVAAAGVAAADSLAGRYRYIHDTYLWLMEGAEYPVAEMVMTSVIDEAGDDRPKQVGTKMAVLNLPGEYECQEDDGVKAREEARKSLGDGVAPTATGVTDVEARLAADGRSVTVDYTTASGCVAGERLTLGVFDPTGRQLGVITECPAGAGRHTAEIGLTGLPTGGLLLSVFSNLGEPSVYKINNQGIK